MYAPAEDSFLLAKHATVLRGRVLDMGTGSGILALTNAQANPGNEVIGVDINPEAVECATANALANKIKNARFFVSDLFGNVDGSFDAIILNPPYLPNIKGGSSARSELALGGGGKSGRALTDCFIRKCGAHLNPGGTVLLLQSSINDVERTLAAFRGNSFSAEILETESFFFEKLYVLKAVKA